MDKIEEKIIKIIESHRDELVAFARDIYSHAELGFREFRTSDKFNEQMESLGLKTQRNIAITGVKCAINQDKKANFNLALLGEMDALPITEHRLCNKETGASHCCGHHAQITGVIGAAMALTDPEVAEALDGQVTFLAVPAEEFGEVDIKKQIRDSGKIKYMAGKPQMIAEGVFDDVDLNIVHHIDMPGKAPFTGNGVSNGFVSKVITYEGRASHAAVAPENGINALAAATLGLDALGLNRETFRDEDHVRVHPIMTEGGSVVNVTPSKARLETFVRAANETAMADAAEKTDRSFKAGAMALGAKVTIETIPGYLAGIPMPGIPEVVEAMQLVEGDTPVQIQPESYADAGSSDIGDLQHFRPVVQFRTAGMTGGMHRADYDIVDEEEAYINTAKIFALIAYRMLKDGAAVGKRVSAEHKPCYQTKEEYMKVIDSFSSVEEFDYK